VKYPSAAIAAEQLGVAHDRVGAEVRQVLGLRVGGVAGELATDRARPPGAALVEQEHAVVGERPLHPPRRGTGRPRGLEPRATLEEHQVRAIEPVGGRDLAREHGQHAAVGRAVSQRHGVLSLGEDRAGDPIAGGHRADDSVSVSRFEAGLGPDEQRGRSAAMTFATRCW